VAKGVGFTAVEKCGEKRLGASLTLKPRIFKSSNPQIFKSSNLQIFKSSNLQIILPGSSYFCLGSYL